jgi:hypothetical protein
MVIIQFIREKKAEVLVRPGEIVESGCDPTKFILKLEIDLIVRLRRQSLNHGYAGKKLLSMHPRNINSLCFVNVHFTDCPTLDPLSRVLTFENAKLVCTAPGYTPKHLPWKFFIILKLKPVNGTVNFLV